MRRHAIVKNTETRQQYYVPYDGAKSDNKYVSKHASIYDQVWGWCLDKEIPGPLAMIETGGGKPVYQKLY